MGNEQLGSLRGDNRKQAVLALRKMVEQDPAIVGDLLLDLGYETVNEVPAIDLLEASNEVWIQKEGTEGVWSNFSSAGRETVSGRWPEDKPFGNADTIFYATTGLRSGETVTMDDGIV